MSHNFLFFCCASLFVAISTNHGMEREISSDIITRLTIVKNKPSFVKYLTNNRVIITDEFGTHIVNPITDTIIQKIDYSSSRPILCQNKERIGLAHPLSCYIRVYDIEN